MKIGLIARCDNSGLGRLSLDFYEHLSFDKMMVIIHPSYTNYPDRFPRGLTCEYTSPTLEEIDKFLDGLDILLTFETPYNWNIFSRAREKGIKTILIPNYEWTIEKPPMIPDLWLCPSKLDFDIYSQEYKNVKYLPIPIDRKKIPFRLRKTAETFVFNNGHGGATGRNSAREFLQAISLVPIGVKFIFRTQVYLEEGISDKRVTIKQGEIPFKDLWKEGDVFVFPHKFDGLSLPIQEAMAAGMPIISTNIYPHNTYLPKELLFEPEAMGKVRMSQCNRVIDTAMISPKILADKITEWANQDISKYSEMMNKQAELWSWHNLGPKYLQTFKDLCKKPTKKK